MCVNHSLLPSSTTVRCLKIFFFHDTQISNHENTEGDNGLSLVAVCEITKTIDYAHTLIKLYVETQEKSRLSVNLH